MLLTPQVLAQRDVGTSIILTTSEFRGCQPVDNGTSIRTISCHHPVPEHMDDGASINLKNYFYWIVNPYGLPTVSVITCIVGILNPQALNYTYSINIPLEYTVNASNQTWAEIDSEKYSRNITLDGLLSGDLGIDVDYDGNYRITVYGQANNSVCSAIALFTVDRTSEFWEQKPYLVGIIIISLFIIAGYLLYIGRKI